MRPLVIAAAALLAWVLPETLALSQLPRTGNPVTGGEIDMPLSAGNRPAVNGPAVNGPTVNGPAVNGPAGNRPADDSSGATAIDPRIDPRIDPPLDPPIDASRPPIGSAFGNRDYPASSQESSSNQTSGQIRDAQNREAATIRRADEELPIKTFIFLDEAGNPVVRPGTTWEEYERVVRSIQTDRRSRQRTITFHRTNANVALPSIDAEATDVDISFEFTVASDQGRWVSVPMGLMGLHLLEPPVVTTTDRSAADRSREWIGGPIDGDFFADPNKTSPPEIEHRVIVDPRRGGYVMEFRLNKTRRLGVSMKFEAAVQNDGQQSMQFDLPSAVTTITLQDYASRGMFAADDVAVEGRGGELVRVRGQDLVVQSGGGPLLLSWGREEEKNGGDLLEATTRMDLRFDDAQSSPIASVSMSLRNLRGSVRQLTLRLPDNTVLLDTPRLGIDGRELSFQTQPDPKPSLLTFEIPSREKQSRVEVTYELRWIGGSGTAAEPLEITVPAVQGVLRHRGSVTLSTDPPSRMRWRPAKWVRAVGRTTVDGGTVIDRFDFDRQSFRLPVYLVGQTETIRLQCDSKLVIEPSSAQMQMLATITGRGETGRLLLDTAGWDILSVRDADTKILLETYREATGRSSDNDVADTSDNNNDNTADAPSIQRRPLVIAGGGGGNTSESTTSLEIVATRMIDNSQSPARMEIPVLRAESVSTSSADQSDFRSTTVPADRTLTIQQSGRTGFVVDLAASPSVLRRETASDQLDLRSLGERQPVTTYYFGDTDAAELVGAFVKAEPPIQLSPRGRITVSDRDQSTSEITMDLIAKLDLEGRLDFAVPGYPGHSCKLSVLVDEFPGVVRHLGGENFRLISERLGAGKTRLSFTITQTNSFAKDTTRPESDTPPRGGRSTQDADDSVAPVQTIVLPWVGGAHVTMINPMLLRVTQPGGSKLNFNVAARQLSTAQAAIDGRFNPLPAQSRRMVLPGDRLPGDRLPSDRLPSDAASGGLMSGGLPAGDGPPGEIMLGDLAPGDMPLAGDASGPDAYAENPTSAPSSPTPTTLDGAMSAMVSYELAISNMESLPIEVKRVATERPGWRLELRRGSLLSQVGTRTRRDKFDAMYRGDGDLAFKLQDGQIDPQTIHVAASVNGQQIEVEQDGNTLRLRLDSIRDAASFATSAVSTQSDWRALSLEVWAQGRSPSGFASIKPILVPPPQIDSFVWDLTMPSDWHLISRSSSARSLMRWKVDGLSLRRHLPPGFRVPTPANAPQQTQQQQQNQRPVQRPANRYVMAVSDVEDVHVRLASQVTLWLVFGSLVMAVAAAVFHLPRIRGPQSVLLVTVAIGGLMVYSPDAAVIFGQIVLLVMILVAIVLAINSLLRESLRRPMAGSSRRPAAWSATRSNSGSNAGATPSRLDSATAAYPPPNGSSARSIANDKTLIPSAATSGTATADRPADAVVAPPVRSVTVPSAGGNQPQSDRETTPRSETSEASASMANRSGDSQTRSA